MTHFLFFHIKSIILCNTKKNILLATNYDKVVRVVYRRFASLRRGVVLWGVEVPPFLMSIVMTGPYKSREPCDLAVGCVQQNWFEESD